MNSTGALIKIAYRNIWRNRRRTLFCLTAVGFAVFFIAFYSAFTDGLTRNINDIVQIFDTGHVRVVSVEFDGDNEFLPVQFPVSHGENVESLTARVRTIPGVRAVLPRIETFASLHESTVKHAMLWGLNVEDEIALNNFNLINRNSGLVEGHWPRAGSNDAAVGWSFARRTGLSVGDFIPLSTMSAQFSDRPWEPRVTGIFAFDYMRFDDNYIIVDFERLQRLLVLDGATQQLVIFAYDERLSSTVAAQVQTMLGGEGNVVRDWRDNFWVAVLQMARPIYMLVYLIFLVVACLLIINTVVMIIHERIKEIGMMGSLGMTRREIVTVFFFESVFMSAIGAFAGIVLGGIVTGVGQFFPLRWTDLTGNTFAEFPAGDAVFLEFNVVSLVRSWVLGVVVASVFTLIPSLKSAFVEPVEALRR